MPTYVVTDPATNRRVRLTGDSPPTEAEIAHVFGALKQPAPAAPPGPNQPFGGLGIKTVSDEDWARLTPQQKMNGVLEAVGKAIAPMIGLGPDAVEHPKTTLAGMAVPAAVRSGVGPVARTAGALLQKPAVGATIGAIEGYQYGDLPGAALGAVMGAAGSKAGQALRSRGPQPVPRQDSAALARGRVLEQTLRSGSVDDVLALGPPRAAAAAARPVASPPSAGVPFKYGQIATGPSPRVSRIPTRASAAPAAPAASPPASPVPVAGSPAVQTAPPAPRTSSAGVSPSAPAHDTAGRTLHTPWAARTKGQQSVQSVRNDLGIAAKRSKVELSEPQYAEAAQLVRQGKTAVEAVAETAKTQTGAAAAPKAAPVKPPARMRLTPDETAEYQRLVQAGKSELEAKLAIVQQRELVAATGATPLPKARARVAVRQATGRWPEGTP